MNSTHTTSALTLTCVIISLVELALPLCCTLAVAFSTYTKINERCVKNPVSSVGLIRAPVQLRIQSVIVIVSTVNELTFLKLPSSYKI